MKLRIVTQTEASNQHAATNWTDQFLKVSKTNRNDIELSGYPGDQVWAQFLKAKVVFEKEFAVCFDDSGRCHGRIGVALMPIYQESGAIGFYEASKDSEVAECLVDWAKNWLRKRNVKKAIGPLNWNTWFSYRFRTDQQPLHFSWEPLNPEHYPRQWQDLGFLHCESYHSVICGGLKSYVKRTQAFYEELVLQGYTFRTFHNGTEFLSRDLPSLFRISVDAFKNNFLYQPIDFEQFRDLYIPLVNKMDLSLCYFVSNDGGEDVGFFFGFLDPSNSLVLKSVGVLTEYRGLGLSNALSHLLAKGALKRGIDRYISALMRKGIQSESYSRKGAFVLEHTYELYQYDL
jgi:hypothetical protein